MKAYTTPIYNCGAIALLTLLLTACGNWVQLTPEGGRVELSGDATQISNCIRAGRASVKTLDQVIGIERGGQRLQDELLTLARNEAADLGGDTIIPESVITEGVQIFGIYKCRR